MGRVGKGNQESLNCWSGQVRRGLLPRIDARAQRGNCRSCYRYRDNPFSPRAKDSRSFLRSYRLIRDSAKDG